ncbi:MAG: GNAT family N-acetyltransferase [Burkholderiaceae bacterium]
MSLPSVALALPGWTLRAWRAADAESLAQHASNIRIWRNMSDGFPFPYSLAVARHWVDRGHIALGGSNWAIACDDLAVGGAGIHPGEGQSACSVEIGYWLGEAYWGRGVSTQVVAALTRIAFEPLGVTRVFAPVHADNPASMRVLEKNGFEREGLQRRSVIKAGEPIDICTWARIRA